MSARDDLAELLAAEHDLADDDDPLAAARGLVFGCLLGLFVFAFVVLLAAVALR